AKIQAPLQNPMNKKEFMVLQAEGKINRKDFGIGKTFSDAVVGDEVKIELKLEAYAQ
ncbi:YceI family protein, partial [Helicobacter pylori]